MLPKQFVKRFNSMLDVPTIAIDVIVMPLNCVKFNISVIINRVSKKISAKLAQKEEEEELKPQT